MPRKIKPHEKHQEQYVTYKVAWEIAQRIERLREPVSVALGLDRRVADTQLFEVMATAAENEIGIMDAMELMAAQTPEGAFRYDVKCRDGHRCFDCGTSRDLHVHHIITRNECHATGREDLLLDPDNGITLCADCHREVTGEERKHAPRFQAHVTACKEAAA